MAGGGLYTVRTSCTRLVTAAVHSVFDGRPRVEWKSFSPRVHTLQRVEYTGGGVQ